MPNIDISPDKNTVTIDGIEYEAIPFQRCSGCALNGFAICHKVTCVDDNRNIQFKLKQDAKH